MTEESVSGIIRRRRNLSRKLTFFDVELQDARGHTLEANRMIQLVCEWPNEEVPKCIVAGLHVSATGQWDKRGRWEVFPGQLSVIMDERGSSPWDNASVAQNIRQRYQPLLAVEDWCERSEKRRKDRMQKKHLAAEDYAHKCNSNNDGDATDTHCMKDKGKHNIVFTRWLLATFGDRLKGGKHGTGVCDIAGGRGLIALELTLNYNIQSILIEPKPLNLNSTSRKRIKKWYKKHDNDHEDIVSSTKTNLINNAHNVPKKDTSMTIPIVHLQSEFYCIESGLNTDEVMQAVEGCSVLLAMHPDQATGAVVEAAIKLGKPFAIVPCCVFARQFPERFTPSGSVVSSYEDLCDWIQAQHADIRRDILPFHGRNVVLYRL